MTAIWSILGVAVIATVLRDIFHELFHPAGTGTMSSLLMRVGWRAFHRAASHREGLMKLAGPSLMLLVLAVWSGSLAVGWALVFWPYMPDAFLLSTGLEPSSNSAFLDALYFSAVTLATLGYGDISPSSTPLRMLAPAEALVGFALLTVGISWVLSLYPILPQRRSVAHRLWLLRGTEQETGLSMSDCATDPDALLQDLVTELTSIRRSMIQFPISYHFHTADEKNSLPVTLPYLLHLSRGLEAPGNPASSRLRATVLRKAVEDLATTLNERFLDLSRYASVDEVLEAYALDHLQSTSATPDHHPED